MIQFGDLCVTGVPLQLGGSTSTVTMSVATLTEAGSPTTSDSPQSDVIMSTSRRHGATRRRTSAGSGDMAADDRPRFIVGVDEDSAPTRRASVRSRRSAAAAAVARPPSPPPDRDASSSAETPDTGNHVIQSDARPTDITDSGATTRRRMTAAERRRLKAELLSSSSLEVSYVLLVVFTAADLSLKNFNE